MRTSEAARYARWAATAAVVLALVAAGVYAWRQWQTRQALKDAPAPVPVTVQRQSETFSFSKVEGERTLFTVRASQLTELREGGKSLLEDVWITIYGRAGQRYDNIHASKCDYLPLDGRITCAGDVQMDLESAEEAKEHPGQRAIRIRTAHVSFLRETGEARTEQPVEFQFEYGQGRAVGVTYSTEHAVVRLERDVEMTLTSAGRGQSVGEPLALSASAMEYRRDARTMRLLGPVRAHQGLRELTAEAMTMEFDTAMRAQRLVAGCANGATATATATPTATATATPKATARSTAKSGCATRPQLKWAEADGSSTGLTTGGTERQLEADEFVALFARDGHVTRLAAQGSVSGSAGRGGRQDRLAAQQAVVEFDARNEPRTLEAQGGVRMESQSGSRAQRLETEGLRLEFPQQRAGRRSVSRGQTLAPAVVELRDGAESTRLRAARLETDFGARNRVDRLRGSGGVEMVRRLGNGPEQRTASDQFAVTFGAGGEWTQAELAGKVRYREGERTAEAERARVLRTTDVLTLEGPATVGDALTRTTAGKIEINQRTGEALATSKVRTSYLRAGAGKKDNAAARQGGQRGAEPNLAGEPAHITADQLRASRDVGKAAYSGHVRLWQGDAVIEAEQMELLREGQRIEARGKVRGVFPQAVGAAGSEVTRSENPESKDQHRGHRDTEVTEKTEKRGVVRFAAGRLTYLGAQGRAKLEEGVTAELQESRMAAREMTLEFGTGDGGAAEKGAQPFAPQGAAQGKQAVGSGAQQAAPLQREGRAVVQPPGPSQQVVRAEAVGGCTVRQGARRGTAERCTYEAAEGKFVLSGGEPSLADPVLGITTGRQLTFFLADDRILVESAEGTRTVTRHRVEK